MNGRAHSDAVFGRAQALHNVHHLWQPTIKHEP